MHTNPYDSKRYRSALYTAHFRLHRLHDGMLCLPKQQELHMSVIFTRRQAASEENVIICMKVLTLYNGSFAIREA